MDSKATFNSRFLYLLLFLNSFVLPFSNEFNSNSNLPSFVWLVQVEEQLSPLLKHIRSRKDSDVIAIAWKNELPLDHPER